jgi:hypothetical protein
MMKSESSFPLKHISIRVPWHDSGWNGSVCKSPSHNTACIKLVNIANSKDDAQEDALAGTSLRSLDSSAFPPCVKERATFMANFALERYHEHPYVRSSPKTHAHFKPTRLRYPAYAAAALPFRWMMKPVVFGDKKKQIAGLIEDYPLDSVDRSYEPELSFQTHWVQDHRNHQALLDCFWNHVRAEESLVFFYAKQVPLVEDTGRRVLIGAGRVVKIGPLTEYDYQGSTEGKIRSLLWERMVIHTIRPDFKDGFLLPYNEALEKSHDGLNFDPAEVVALAPEDRFTEFSFATEHVGNDAAIDALLACRAALLRAGELFSFQSQPQERWIDKQLGRLWRKRGAFPGIGSILTATGVPMGNFIAQALTNKVGEEGNPWEAWRQAINAPDRYLPKDLATHLDATIIKSWKRMPEDRRRFLELLSRVDLTLDQANVLAIPEVRQEEGLELSDADFINNPYLIYEGTRLSAVPVSIGAVDRGMFPTALVREQSPLPEPSLVKTAVDARRLRALVVRELEMAAQRGDTLRAQSDMITSLRRRDESSNEQRTEVTSDLLAVAEEEQFPGEIRTVELADGRRAYQLERLSEVGELIRNTVKKRSEAKRHELQVDWSAELDKRLGAATSEADDRVKEERARREKATALAELAAARFSVLIGPAGTGKTTLLSVLCGRPEISKDGILLLAPTGKARVRMEDVARQAGTQNFQALTLAQFLSRSGRYDGSTQRYLLTGETGEKTARTVIVDECSMLTEEMMAALIEAISGVHRLIFVGDHRQLPPIGAGRPFADIIAALQPADIETSFPRVAPSYAELTIPRRQGAGERDDLQLAAWFGGNVISPGEDQVFEILAGKRESDTVHFIHWETPDELERELPIALADALWPNLDLKEWQAFACSLGGNLDDRGSAWFNARYGTREGSGRAAEAWQVLSPVRQKPWGVDTLNRLIHSRYKAQQIERARQRGGYRSIPPPRGEHQIIYGDKVINNRNWSVPKTRIYPNSGERGYLANGEIGMVVGHRRMRRRNWEPENLEIEFSTQQGTVFTFYKSDFSDEKESSLELAYALTVHKAQGSEFEVVFLVLPRSLLMITRELLYTALTRQKQKVVILHQGSATDLQRLSSERYSATATRLTNLFGPPRPVAIGQAFLEDRLIHRTMRGDAVRSKSEVIIANLLHAAKIEYHYEIPLEFEGVTKYPDFTIEDDDAGITYYWEHCGLLHDPAYSRRWEEKEKWYRSNGILPLQEGGGPKGTLIVTRDEIDGGIDSKSIGKMIKEVFGA